MDHWKIITNKAREMWRIDQEFKSLVDGNIYKIESVDEKIKVERVYGDTPAYLREKNAINAINILRGKGRVKNNTKSWVSQAAIRSTMVQLHPFIHYDEVEKWIYWKESNSEIDLIINRVKDAPNDVFQRILIAVQERLYQSKFRRNILTLYNGKCAITGTDVEEVLEAAHIFRHSESGDNSNENGILLRRDLHKLFDDHLIAIDPETKKICIHNSLKGSYYERYSGQKIDGSEINSEYLKSKFDKFKNL